MVVVRPRQWSPHEDSVWTSLSAVFSAIERLGKFGQATAMP
ncbi:hypothetical protein SNOG_08468 [Parastagonospora nodorum SN15]|uniref:Uncharacterized protein n=1 Tax=Phaeosphaeria nodorum (strain SN15 / ATCC MYA-4574 / FGSC 10173) TaxID=321614 RepID=Q0UIE6_PHANO|nr:hypothetical protein SNOG_08468 [Parastagonospora nodorum SN15]EAT84744.1 hypothetical protein SNOG_08468 [Parastagonospora nodorum SN15]